MSTNTKYLTTIAVLFTIATVIFVPGNVFAANPNTNDPSGWGKLTSGSATTDTGSIGEHSSNPPFEVTPEPGRTGLGNVLQEVTQNPDASKHPSELGEFLCTNFPGVSPCP